jgi:benzoyl-CoA reductase/2-hydroxyglutaryl-CoA dehydratase subunit BcrC/BadD/HgdB
MTVNNDNGLLSSLKRKLEDEPARIAEAKNKGKKIVGYFGPYVPEELILAAGMLPLHLAFGGDMEPASAGEPFLKSQSCAFARSCLGYKQLGKNPYFNAVDVVIVARTCDGMKRVQEYWGKYLGVPAIALGVPQTHDRLRTKPQAVEYFKNELLLIKKALEEIGGRVIKDKDIEQAIILCNGIRENLWTLYEYPVDGRSPIEWRDVYRIASAGFLMERNEFHDELGKICAGLQHRHLEDTPWDKRARLMICGNTIGIGDDKLLDIIQQAGGNIVADSTCSGAMLARKKVKMPGVMGDPIDLLAERYLYNFPCPFMTDLPIRINNTTKVARDYQVHGLVYYALKYCDTWRADFKFIQDELYKELSVPTLLIETDYSPEDSGAIKDKVEAFIKRIEGQL